jgi:hypothetical protein
MASAIVFCFGTSHVSTANAAFWAQAAIFPSIGGTDVTGINVTYSDDVDDELYWLGIGAQISDWQAPGYYDSTSWYWVELAEANNVGAFVYQPWCEPGLYELDGVNRKMDNDHPDYTEYPVTPYGYFYRYVFNVECT